MNNQIIAITGGSGFLGRVIIKNLKDHYSLRVFSRSEENIEGIEPFIGDLGKKEDIENFLRDCSILIHAASITDPFDDKIFETNVGLTENLIVAANKCNTLRKIIYISSENVTYNCNDNYTLSKVQAEDVVKQFHNVLILRPSILFGKGDTRYIYQFTKLIKNFPIIPVPSSKISTIQPISAEDVSQYVYFGIVNDIKGIYTVVGTTPLSFKELGKILCEILNKKRFFIPIPALIIKTGMVFLPKKLKSKIKNALYIRNTNMENIAKIFNYKNSPLINRLQDTLL